MDVLLGGSSKLGIVLSPRHQEQFRRYYQELITWNRRINLTRIVEWEEVLQRHFLDSLVFSKVIDPETQAGGSLLDVGSGAGFPGIPLKIAFPGITLGLLDSVAKKTVFLTHLVKTLELDSVEVHTGRAEDLAHQDELRETFDVVVSRTVAPLRVLWELTLPFARVGGLVVTPRGGDVPQEVEGAAGALEILGGQLKDMVALNEESTTGRRVLLVAEKVQNTASKYPRRAGIPKKRPL